MDFARKKIDEMENELRKQLRERIFEVKKKKEEILKGQSVLKESFLSLKKEKVQLEEMIEANQNEMLIMKILTTPNIFTKFEQFKESIKKNNENLKLEILNSQKLRLKFSEEVFSEILKNSVSF